MGFPNSSDNCLYQAHTFLKIKWMLHRSYLYMTFNLFNLRKQAQLTIKNQ